MGAVNTFDAMLYLYIDKEGWGNTGRKCVSTSFQEWFEIVT